MKLTEWNKVLKYVNGVCESIDVDVRSSVGRTYDGRPYIKLNLYDINGDLFKGFSSGTFDTFDEAKTGIDRAIKYVREII